MEPIQKNEKRILDNAPFGQLGLITVSGCEAMGKEIDFYLQEWRAERQHEHEDSPAFAGYLRPFFFNDTAAPGIYTGEGKGVLSESVRMKLTACSASIITCPLTITSQTSSV